MPEDEIVVGGYRRLNVMQTGQNSEVWEVLDPATQQRYVMKLLLPEKADDAQQRRMLRHEATVAGQLQHPKIIKILKFQNSRDNPFLIMEYFTSSNL
ncbi:MAG: protein kinase domain-containing protein, partial [Planctomycetia bacterium]